MAVSYKRKSTKVYKKKRVMKPKVKYYSKKTSLTSLIKNVMNNEMELKCQSASITTPTALLPYNLGNLYTIDVGAGVLNNITQGTGQGQRISNEINLRSLKLKFVIGVNILLNSGIPCILRMFVGKLKSTIGSPAGNFSNLFNVGNTSVAPINNALDTMRDVNRDYFTVIKQKQFKIGNSQATVGQSNNDFNFCVKQSIELTRKGDKMIKYNDTGGIQNYGLYCWFIVVPADGTTSITVQDDYNIMYDIEAKYTDA